MGEEAGGRVPVGWEGGNIVEGRREDAADGRVGPCFWRWSVFVYGCSWRCLYDWAMKETRPAWRISMTMSFGSLDQFQRESEGESRRELEIGFQRSRGKTESLGKGEYNKKRVKATESFHLINQDSLSFEDIPKIHSQAV